MSGLFRTLGTAVVVLGSCRSVQAQTWVTTTEDYLADHVTRVVQTRDGRFLAVADTGRALALVKRNSDGSLLWQRLLMGSPPGEAGFDLVELADGRIVAAGDAFVGSHGNDDAFLAIVSEDGSTLLRQRTYGGPEGDDRARGLVSARDGGWLLVGETRSWGGPGRRMLLVRVGPGLDPQWVRVYRSPGGDDVLYSGVELPTGEFLVAGGSGSVLKLEADGDLLWSRTYGLSEIRRIAPAPDGGFVLAGWRPAGADDVAELIEVDAAGEILRRSSYGQTGASYRFFCVASLGDSGFIAGGEVNGPAVGDLDAWVARLDRTGGIVWQRRLEGGGEVQTVARADDGSLLAGGFRESFPRMMVARLDDALAAPGCGQSATTAARIPSPAGWAAGALSAIDAATFETAETGRMLVDPLSPEDRTVCAGGPGFPPSEVSPPSAPGAPLIFLDPQTLTWEEAAPSASTAFDLYRGDLADLRSGRGPECFIADLPANAASDGEIPPPGSAFVYLAGGRNGAGKGGLGSASDGSERRAGVPCP